MADLVRWNPYDELQRLRDDFGRFFGLGSMIPWIDTRTPAGIFGPLVDVRETDTDVVVSAEIPGVDPNDVDIVVTDDSLSIKGETRQETNANERGYRRIERRYGSFERTIPFPSSVKHEMAKADYRNGVLEITVPKADPQKGKATRLKLNKPDERH